MYLPDESNGARGLSNYRSALRVLREVEGDFTAQVKVSGQFNPGNKAAPPQQNAFNGAGLLLWDSEQNYLRLERNIWVTAEGDRYSYAPLVEYWQNGQNLTDISAQPASFFRGRSTSLRLTRRGDEIRVAVSHDGAVWTDGRTVAARFPKKVRVGVAAINTSKKPFTVEFSEFKVSEQ